MNKLLSPGLLAIGLALLGTLALSCSFAQLWQAPSPETSSGTQLMTKVSLHDGDTYDMTISPITKQIGNKDITAYGYNGTFPGPIITVPQGAHITLRIKNNLDTPTLLHPHGVRTENKGDGSHLVQKAIKPGETYLQELSFPDPGLYWYHPHMSEVKQQELGLYGTFLVTPKDPTYWPPVNHEEVTIVDDILLDNGTPPFTEQTDHELMGRYGNTMLINGTTDWQLQAHKGEVIRFYLLNAANTRTFNLSIPGAKLKRVGGDEGAYEKAIFEESLLLSPSERVIVDAYFPEAGSYKLMHKGTEEYTMGTIHVDNVPATPSYVQQFTTLQTNSSVQKDMAMVRPFMDKPVDKELQLTMNMQGMDDMKGMQMTKPASIEWEDTMNAMNKMATKENTTWKFLEPSTGKTNMQIQWNFKQGDLVKIKIFNDPNSPHPMQHPIHLHGNRMVVLKRDGKPETNMVWKDTVLVQTGETVEVLADMSNPGKWMIHCHISEHLDNGMMFLYNVSSN